MTKKHMFRTAALAGVFLLPLAAAAQDDFSVEETAPKPPPKPVFNNEVSVGAGYQSKDSVVFGRYTGLVDKGAFAIGDFSVRQRDDWNSGGTRYLNAEGHNLGLTSRFLGVDMGYQGWLGMKLFYDGIPYYESNSFKTIYDTSGQGTLNNGLTASTTPFFRSAALAPFLQQRDVNTQRDTFGGSLNYKPTTDWVVTTGLKHEHKEGIQERSMIFGTGKSAVLQGLTPCLGAANPAAGCTNANGLSGSVVNFPLPIDYDTDRYEASIAYNGREFQALVGYTYSQFTDNNISFNAIDPFQSPSATTIPPNVGAPGSNNLGPVGTLIRGAYSTPPSNSAHQVNAQFGLNVTPTTRVNANFSYGLMFQDAAYAPDTLNSFLLTKAGLTSHPASLDGAVHTFYGNFTVTSRPLPKLDLRASFTVDDRHNKTDANKIQSVYVDAWRNYTNEGLAANGATPFVYSTDIRTLRLEGGYRVLPQTKLTLGYMLKDTTRNQSDVTKTTENAFSARVNSSFFTGLNGSVGYEHSVRTNDNFDGTIPWVYQGFPGPNGAATGTNQNGGIVPFFEAPRTRDEVKLRLTATPRDDFSVSGQARATNNHYSATLLGLTDDYSIAGGPDVTWTPSKNLAAHAFYTYEKIYRSLNGNLTTSAPGVVGRQEWSQKSDDQVHTIGLSADWQPIEDLLKIGSNLNFSIGDIGYDVRDGLTPVQATILGNQGYVIQALPNVKSQLYSFTLHGEYQFLPNTSLWFGYTYERFIYSDYAISASSNPIQYGNALLPGNGNPSYNVHVIGTALRLKF